MLKPIEHMPIKLDLQYFAEEIDNNPTEENQTSAETENTETKESDKKAEQRMIPYDRFKQVNDDLKMFKETFESLGLGGVDSLKELVEDYNAKKQADEQRKREEMTELDRLQTDLEAKTQVEKALEEEVQQLKEQLRKNVISSAFTKAATESGVAYVDAAFKLADLSQVEIDEDGNVQGMAEAIEKLLEDNPFIVRQEEKKPKTIGNPSNPSHNDESKTLQAQLEEAKKKKDFGKVIELSNKIKGLLK